MLDTLTAETFTGSIGDTFNLILEGAPPVELQLISVTDRSAFASGKISREQGMRMPFSIVFRGPLKLHLPQHIYHIEHARLEPMDIFIVPIGPDQEGMLYEAVFS